MPSGGKQLGDVMRGKRIQPVSKRGKTFNRCQVRENYIVNHNKVNESDGKWGGSVGKMPTQKKYPSAQRIFSRHQPRENMSVFPAQEKHSSCPVRWKTIIWCDARENIQPVPSLLKLLADAMRRKRTQPVSKRAKTFNWCQAAESN